MATAWKYFVRHWKLNKSQFNGLMMEKHHCLLTAFATTSLQFSLSMTIFQKIIKKKQMNNFNLATKITLHSCYSNVVEFLIVCYRNRSLTQQDFQWIFFLQNALKTNWIKMFNGFSCQVRKYILHTCCLITSQVNSNHHAIHWNTFELMFLSNYTKIHKHFNCSFMHRWF